MKKQLSIPTDTDFSEQEMLSEPGIKSLENSMDIQDKWSEEHIQQLRELNFDGEEIGWYASSEDQSAVSCAENIFSTADIEMFSHFLDPEAEKIIQEGGKDPAVREKGGEKPAQTFSYPISRQRRPGTSHGKGGRKILGSASQRRKAIPESVCSIISRRFCSMFDDNIPSLVSSLEQTLSRLSSEPKKIWTSDLGERMKERVEALISGKVSLGSFFEIIPECPYIAICFKFPFSQVGIKGASVMDRHTVCSWIGEGGKLYCSCAGSTKYRIKELLLEKECDESEDLCIHLEGVFAFVQEISECYGMIWKKCAMALAEIHAKRCSVSVAEFNLSCPKVSRLHNRKVAVISEINVGRNCASVQLTPVRVTMKGGERFICAFCDTTYGSNCHHVKAVKSIPGGCPEEESETKSARKEDKEMEEAYMPFLEEDKFESMAERDHISHLPLSPVNCVKALEVDFAVVRSAVDRKPYFLEAPPVCSACGSARNSKTRKIWKDGVIMCTIGPCVLHTEEFSCSNDSFCSAKIKAEGRCECVLLDKNTSAATHALLRRELLGVALSNGTLTGRLKHFHSQVISHMHGGVIPFYPFSRSVKTMQRLCTIMLVLMTLSPNRKMFECETCEYRNGQKIEQVPVICVDGIYQGYVKAKQVSTKNISQDCKPIPYSDSASNGSTRRPLTRLIRREKAITILLKAISGKEILCSQENVKDLAMSIRLVSKDVLPPHFCSESICGRTPNDYHNDIGDRSVVTAVRKFTTKIFQTETLLLRLLQPLEAFHRECVESERFTVLQKLGAFSREPGHNRTRKLRRFPSLSENLKIIFTSLQKTKAEPLRRNGVCWRQCISGAFFDDAKETGSGSEFRNEIMNLYKMFLQGPITQFVRKMDIDSLRNLGVLCCAPNLDHLLAVLREPKKLAGVEDGANILHSCRYVLAGTFNIAQLERNGKNVEGYDIREALGYLFLSSADCVSEFYRFYDSPLRQNSAMIYADSWKSEEGQELLDKMNREFPAEHVPDGAFESAVKTGTYFPSRPQVRPLPFNADEITDKYHEKLGPCSKGYYQKQKSYTPGALTVNCPCAKPITFGIHVLDRDEGPKVVLDIILSRFTKLPRFIVYDFACGLYSSAIHCL